MLKSAGDAAAAMDVFLDMLSYADDTVRRVAKFLDGRMIDALFIDGDHRYEGVKQDFLCYRHFVRERRCHPVSTTSSNRAAAPAPGRAACRSYGASCRHSLRAQGIRSKSKSGSASALAQSSTPKPLSHSRRGNAGEGGDRPYGDNGNLNDARAGSGPGGLRGCARCVSALSHADPWISGGAPYVQWRKRFLILG